MERSESDGRSGGAIGGPDPKTPLTPPPAYSAQAP
jgi:hypothetical protein